MNAVTTHHHPAKLAACFRQIPGILCLTGLFVAQTAEAQSAGRRLFELSMEELLNTEFVSAPRFASEPGNIPAAVTIIDQNQIRLYGWQTFDDILQSLPGFNVSNDHTYSYAAVRGLATAGDLRSRVQVLVNGIRINENIYDSVNIDTSFLLDLSNINRIEIIRGPSASVYGGNSMVAVINVVTYTGDELEGLRLNMAAGSGDTITLGSSWGKVLDDTDMLFTATAFTRDGRNNIYPELAEAGLPAEASGVDADEGYRLAGVVNHGDLRLSLFSSDRKKFVPNGSYGTVFNDSTHYERDKLTIGELRYTHESDSGSSWSNRLYYGDYEYDGVFPYAYDSLYIINQDEVRGSWWGLESSWIKAIGNRNNLVMGVEYRENFRQQLHNFDQNRGCYDIGQTEPCIDTHIRSEVWSLYVQDEIRLTDLTRATLGWRLDKASQLATQPSPRFGLVHTTEHAGTFKYLYAKAFRNPSPFERFYDYPLAESANPNLAAEAINSHELTWEKQFGASNRLVTSVYRYKLHDFIAVGSDGRFGNSDEFSVNGVEATWTGAIADGLGYSLSLSHQAENKSGSLDQEVMPMNMLKVNVAIPTAIEFLSTGIEFRAASNRETIIAGATAAGYAITNINLLYQPPAREWWITAGVQDVFDREYEDPARADEYMAVTRDRIRQLGRSWTASLHYRF